MYSEGVHAGNPVDSSDRSEGYLCSSINLRVKALQAMNLNAPYRSPLLHEAPHPYAVTIFPKSLRTLSTLSNTSGESNRPFRNPSKMPFLRRSFHEEAFNVWSISKVCLWRMLVRRLPTPNLKHRRARAELPLSREHLSLTGEECVPD